MPICSACEPSADSDAPCAFWIDTARVRAPFDPTVSISNPRKAVMSPWFRKVSVFRVEKTSPVKTLNVPAFTKDEASIGRSTV